MSFKTTENVVSHMCSNSQPKLTLVTSRCKRLLLFSFNVTSQHKVTMGTILIINFSKQSWPAYFYQFRRQHNLRNFFSKKKNLLNLTPNSCKMNISRSISIFPHFELNRTSGTQESWKDLMEEIFNAMHDTTLVYRIFKPIGSGNHIHTGSDPNI